jgi:hypothetical protein
MYDITELWDGKTARIPAGSRDPRRRFSDGV